MKKISLFSQEGIYLTTVMTPNFITWPEVIIWGDRVFKDTPDGYRECFGYWAPLTAQLKEDV